MKKEIQPKLDLNQYRNEPERDPNPKMWLTMKDKLATILVERVRDKLKEPHEGFRPKENFGRSEATTEKTISLQESAHFEEKDR